jgi:hypothetical protein
MNNAERMSTKYMQKIITLFLQNTVQMESLTRRNIDKFDEWLYSSDIPLANFILVFL